MIRAIIRMMLFLILVSGCVTRPPRQNQVTLSPDVKITLPSPGALGYDLTAGQLITARWGDEVHHLPVQLEVEDGEVSMAGFSSWGSRILSLKYRGDELETEVLPGLNTGLPEPAQVLFNLMVTLWPLDAWSGPLRNIGWRLEQECLVRRLLDARGRLVSEITYAAENPFAGDITFHNFIPAYTITIVTLNYTTNQKTTPSP